MKTCPKCLTKINNPEAVFCYNCGGRLTVEDIETRKENFISSLHEDHSVKENKIPNSDINKELKVNSFKTSDMLSKRWNYFIVGVNALSLMFLVVALGFFFRSVNTNKTTLEMYPVVSIESVEIEGSSKIKLVDYVNKSQYYSITPKNVNSYSEMTGIESVITNIMKAEHISYLEKTFDMKLKDFLVFFKKDFAYVRKDDDYALIFKVGGFDFFDRAYSKYQENKVNSASIHAKRVGEFFVISDSSDFIKSMDLVIEGKESSLGADPKFKSKLSEVGINSVYFGYVGGNYFKEYVDKDLARLNLQSIQNSAIKFKPSLIYLAKEGSKYVLYPVE